MERLLAASEAGSLMAAYMIHLMGQHQAITIDLTCDNIDDG